MPEQNVACDFFCFTDSDWPAQVGQWRIVTVKPAPDLHPRMQAKYFKLLSHRVFPNGRLARIYDHKRIFAKRQRYDATLWIDGSIQVKSRYFVSEFLSTIGASGWAMFRHPDRDCIFEEAQLSMTIEKYRGFPIEQQVLAYKESGIAAKSGLYACGIIGRKEPLSSALKSINDMWWRENRKWSYQDQLSLPYVLHKRNFSVDTPNKNQWRNAWFDWIPHRTEA
jgi:hypothetical protein